MSLTTIKVRGYHLDLYGHVNNARYLEFLEEARWALIETHINLGELKNRGYAFVIVNININYRHAAGLGDVLEIRSNLERIKTKSAVVHQVITLAESGKPIADADITFVILDIHSNKVVPIAGELRVMLDGSEPKD
jgi:thioesterase-3